MNQQQNTYFQESAPKPTKFKIQRFVNHYTADTTSVLPLGLLGVLKILVALQVRSFSSILCEPID